MTSSPLVKTKTYDEQSSKNWQFLSPPLSTAFKGSAPSGHLGNIYSYASSHLHIFTTRKRSLVQGNVFTRACHPVHRGGGCRWLSSMHHRSHAQHPRRVCLQKGLPTGSLVTGGSGYRRVRLQGSASRGSVYRGSAFREVCLQGVYLKGVCIQGGLPTGGSASGWLGSHQS